MRPAFPILLLCLALAPGSAGAATDKCRTGASALSDAKSIAGVRGAINRQCPCADYDGTTPAKRHSAYVRCVTAVVNDATDGTPLLGAFTLRDECRRDVRRIYTKAACGYAATAPRVMCCEAKPASGKTKGAAKKASRCVSSTSGSVLRHACLASPFAPDACSFDATNSCTTLVVQETVDIPSAAAPAETPGTPGVVVTNPKLLAQFGGGSFTLNRARYTRHHLAGSTGAPQAILIGVPGFEGGAGDFKVLAESVITRAKADGLEIEVWAFDRRSNQLEDLVGLDIAEEFAHRPWHTNVRCTWDRPCMRLEAQNAWDRETPPTGLHHFEVFSS